MKQTAVAAKQFGETAAAYLTSAVHAQGADLQALKEIAGGIKAAKVLDLGCGGGHVSFAVAPFAASVVACDLSAQMLGVVAAAADERGLANVTTQQAQAEVLPFADVSFDLIVTRFSAHHWFDVAAGLREAHRVLRPGGVFVVIDVVAPEHPLHDTTMQAVELLRDASHVRDYPVSEWNGMLTAAGFAAEHVHGWKLKMVFDDWIARMRTPAERVAAIRSLFDSAPEETRAYFAVEEDYSFTIDAAMFRATTA
ncbi:MAG TPA: methyltransferase domain-containing protein [Oxalicibacterium sp.]|nr:methyltransferase domain-containing protein [Oxalicibacterium sp.]